VRLGFAVGRIVGRPALHVQASSGATKNEWSHEICMRHKDATRTVVHTEIRSWPPGLRVSPPLAELIVYISKWAALIQINGFSATAGE